MVEQHVFVAFLTLYMYLTSASHWQPTKITAKARANEYGRYYCYYSVLNNS